MMVVLFRRCPPGLLSRALVLTLALVASAARAQTATPRPPSQYTLREWHPRHGLPSEELDSVLQDAEGYLWVACTSGLARFDGSAFETPDPPPGRVVPALARLHDEADGEEAGALAAPGYGPPPTSAPGWYSFAAGAWTFHEEESLAERTPRSIFAGPDGSLWLGCDDGTALRRRGDETTLLAPPADLAGRKLPDFATDSTGRLWIARGDRLARVEGGGLVDIPYKESPSVIRIASSPTGGIWLLTRTALLRREGDSFQEIVPLPRLLGAHFVQAALEDRNGCLWLGTRSQGLFRIAGREILNVPTSGENVISLCEDAEGNLWAATDGGGLSRIRPRAHRLLDKSSGLQDNFSYTVAGDAAGTVWLGNRDGSLARVEDGRVDPLARRANWRTFSVMSVFPSPDGHIWMTTGLGVYRIHIARPEMVEAVAPLSHLRNVRATFVARNGDYWLAADPDRVARWRDDRLVTFGAEDGFEGSTVRAFAEDPSGRIWLGAADGRLFRMKGERFERLSFPGAEDCGALQVIRFEEDGRMLVGTTRRGVVVFPEGDLSRPLSLDRDHGLPNNNISQIVVDDHDRTWFASREGIFWVHGRHLRDFAAGRAAHVHAITLGEDDGLPDLSCLGLFQPAAWKAADGTLWFATRRGVVRTEPDLVASSGESPPPVTISSVTCDGRRAVVADQLEISSDVRKIQIRLSALNLSAPGSVQVRFRLEGFDDDWVTQGADRLVTFPRLLPGRYAFSTRTSNGSGLWRNQPGLLTIVVNPPWWQSLWARAVYLVALVATVTVVVRSWSHRRLRRRLARSEQARAVERERTRIARNIHDDLGATLTRISLLTQAAQDENPTLSPTLEKIYEATRAITRSMDEIVWAVNPQHDNTESLVYYLGNFAQGFLGAAGMRCRLVTPGTMPEAPLNSQKRHHLFLCCKEALNNVVKHARATEATVRISLQDKTLVVAIADNGCGLAASREAEGEPEHARFGNGLRNIRQRMSDIRGSCSIESRPAGGTTITLGVPLTSG